MKRHFRELSVLGTLIVLLVVMAALTPNFFDPQPLLSRMTAAAPRLILACGVALVIIARQIDISIGALFAVCGTCAGMMAASKVSLALAMLAAIALGGLGGIVNGALVA